MADQNNKIGWDLPGCPPGGAPGSCHPPTAPVLPHIPNSTGVIIQPTSCSSLESSVDNKYNYGCCAPPPPGELVTQDLVQENFTVPHRMKLDKPGCWIRGTQGSIPAGAVVGGQEPDGQPLYVARAEYEGSLTPGKLSSHGMHIPWGSAERQVETYEVLCGVNGTWARATEESLPEKALKAGYSEDGEVLYLGRVKYEGHFIPGKVQPSHKVCYVSYGGKEISYKAFEVFVVED